LLINDDDYSDSQSHSKSKRFIDEMDTTDLITDVLDNEQDECTEVDLTEAFMQLVGQLECKSDITHANIQVVVDNIQGFMQDVARYCKLKIKNLLLAINVSPECPAADVCLKEIECLPNFLQPIDNENKRIEFLKQRGTFIEPVEVVLSSQNSSRYSASTGFHKASVVEDTMQYVPLELLLGAIISDRDFSQAINKSLFECPESTGIQTLMMLRIIFTQRLTKVIHFFKNILML
jgi:hypothetical protein